jgi:hypothetical protein
MFPSVPVDEPKRSEAYSIHHAARSWQGNSHDWYDAKFHELWIEEIEPVIPPGKFLIMVDKGRAHEASDGRRAIPFPERNGQWAGYPADGRAAVAELERLRLAGAQFIVFPQPMFYWLVAYPELKQVLMTKARCVTNNHHVLIFELAQ